MFRAGSVTQVFSMLQGLAFHFSIHGLRTMLSGMIFFMTFLLTFEFLQYKKNDLTLILHAPTGLKMIFYYVCSFLLIFFGVSGAKQFIYFQF